MAEKLRHIIDSRNIPRQRLEEIFAETKEMEVIAGGRGSNRLMGRMPYFLFTAPSDITRDSFMRATGFLGMLAGGRELPSQSMWHPGAADRDVEDTTLERVVARANSLLYDCIIMRGKKIGDAAKAAALSQIPVINAGEGFDNDFGFGQHPTQAMADVYTLANVCGGVDGIKVVVAGAFKNNPVVNSLLCSLAQFDQVEVNLVTPPAINHFPIELKDYLTARRLRFNQYGEFGDILSSAQVLYIAHSLYSDTVNLALRYGGEVISADKLAKLPSSAVIMHDMIQAQVIDPVIVGDPRFGQNLQERNGMLIRMALLKMLLS